MSDAPVSHPFPPDFLWGASTSSHQVEGHTHNNWSIWEERHASKLAKTAYARYGQLKNWEAIKEVTQQPENYRSGAAAEHYTRYLEDIDLAQTLGLNAYRFSLEWSRIEPRPGHFDQKALDHYLNVIRAVRQRGMEPVVTLWHWTLPLWLDKEGGVASPRSAYYFRRFTEKVIAHFAHEVTTWITINEPEVYCGNSYFNGSWPPMKRGPFQWFHAMQSLVEWHRQSYHVLKGYFPTCQVGIAHNHTYFMVERTTFLNRSIKRFSHYWYNRFFLDQIWDTQDFIGLNHYFRCVINNGFFKNANRRVSDLGWELYPESIYHAIKDLEHYKKPILITENGLADSQDRHRAWYIQEIIHHISRAIAEGASIRGYLHWSLLDNFEWAEGSWPRFGLIEVDYTTQKRSIRPSAYVYAEIIRRYSRDQTTSSDETPSSDS